MFCLRHELVNCINSCLKQLTNFVALSNSVDLFNIIVVYIILNF